jgi:amino acid adenylation domain-containing protein
MVLLAALATVLYRYSGQADVVVGTPVANRERAEFDEMLGCFVNTVPLRCDLDGRPSFTELLGRVRHTALGAFAHEALGFDRILQALDADSSGFRSAGVAKRRPRAHHPLFTVMLVAQPPVPDVALPGGVLRYLGEVHGDKARFDLTVVLEHVDGAPVLSVEYATDLFTEETARRLLSQLRRVLVEAVADPAVRVDRVDLLDDADRAQLRAWGTGPAPATDIDRPAYRVFEDRCAEHPGRVAVIDGDQSHSYADINAAANRLARTLRRQGVGAGTPVGVLLPRSVASVVAMLAVAKAGGAYVPLDPSYPDGRLRLVIADVRPAVVVCLDPARAGELCPPDPVPALLAPEVTCGEASNLDGTPTPDQVAYMIHTSGSTGTPKGVLAHHRGLSNVVAAKIDGFDVRPDSRVLQFVSFGFGVSITDVYMTLTAGATLVVRPDGAVAGRDLAALIRRHEVTNLVLPASVLAALPEEPLPSVRAIAVGGEPCAAALVDQWAPGRHFVQAYGPTEAAVASTMAVCAAGTGTPPIGRPIPGVRVYVLDANGAPTPIGVTGELYIAGAGVSHGYLNRPELTAAAFVPDTAVTDDAVTDTTGGRMYRTGDLAHWRADGQLVLSGRIDDQVQLRGVRVELGDVEAALRAHPAVSEAAAAVREHPVAGQLLVAYLVADPPPTAAELRAFLGARLPEHSVPAVYVPLPRLPRTGTGKLDRRSLPEPPEHPPEVASRPPATVTEEVLAEIWGVVLSGAAGENVEPGAEDDFFVLGGQSILAAAVMAQVRERFEVNLSVRTLFETPTIATLAIRVEQAIIDDLMAEDEAENAR